MRAACLSVLVVLAAPAWAQDARPEGDSKAAQAELAKAKAHLLPGKVDVQAALAAINRALALRPQYAEAYLERALIRFNHLRDEKGARLDATEAIRLRPTWGSAYFLRATVGNGKQSADIADLRLAVKYEPKNQAAQRELGRLLDATGKYKEALTAFEAVIRLGTKDWRDYSYRAGLRWGRKDFKGALADYEIVFKLQKRPATWALYERGTLKLEMGDPKGAIADLDAAIARGAWAEVYYNRGWAKHKLGDFKGALADYDQAIARRLNRGQAFVNRGIVRHELGDPRSALMDFDEAIRRGVKDAGAYLQRGLAHNALGKHAAAIADFTKAVTLRKRWADAWFERGSARDDMGDLAGAEVDLTQALKLRPKFPAAFHNRGVVRHKQGEFKGATADLTRALALRPNWPEALFARGCVEHDRGAYAKAVKDLSQALAVRPKYPQARFKRAFARALSGERKGAVADMLALAKQNPKEVYPRLWIAGWSGGTKGLAAHTAGDTWAAHLARFALGKLSKGDLFKKAQAGSSKKERRERLCEAHGYVGLLAERRGDLVEAKKHYKACLTTKVEAFVELGWARARLEQLEKK